MPKITKKEVIIAAAAVGVAVVVWNFRNQIIEFLFWTCKSSGESQNGVAMDPGKLEPKAQAITKFSPNTSPKLSAEKSDGTAATSDRISEKTGDAAGNTAPEAMDVQKDMAPSAYVGLPKSDPSTVSSSVAPT